MYFFTSSYNDTARDDLWSSVQLLLDTRLLTPEDEGYDPASNEELDSNKPSVLWASFHSQRTQFHPSNLSQLHNLFQCGFPSAMTGYGPTVKAAQHPFSGMFPNLVLMSSEKLEQPALADSDDDVFDDLETELSNMGVPS